MSCFLFTVAWPDGTGAAQMACAYANSLISRGHKVVLACGEVPSAAKQAGDQMLQAASSQGVVVRQVSELGAAVSPKTPYIVRDLIRNCSADAVVSFTQRDQVSGMCGARLAGVAGVLCAQNLHSFAGSHFVQQLKSRVFGTAMRHSVSLAVATSERVRQQLVETFGVKAKRTVVLPNAITVPEKRDIEESERIAIRREFGITPDDQLLVNVGRIDRQKGQDLLIEALAQQSPATRPKLLLIGDVSAGANEVSMLQFDADLRTRIQSLGIQDSVLFAGWRDDVSRILPAADGYVHSARWEGPPLPLAVMEAMAASLPVILTDCMGHPDHFEQGHHGLVVASEDIEELAGAIQHLSGMSSHARHMMGKQSRELIEREYDIHILGGRFADHLQKVLTAQQGLAL